MGDYSFEELKARAFYRVAFVMHSMWQEKGSSDTRLLQAPLIPDHFVVVGVSVAGDEHREHVVPRKWICDESHKMFQEGQSIESVASFIQRHLKIVYISKKEQIHLDSRHGLNLKQRMPAGWASDRDDVFARLREANIEFKIYSRELTGMPSESVTDLTT